MFVGHFAVGLAAKRLTPYTSLGTLVVAVQLLDLIWPTFLMLGIERVRIDPANTAVTPLAFEYYPWTHSLLMSVVWAGALAAVYGLFRRYSRGARVVALAVVSHWLLDFVVHRPDLPLVPGLSHVVGLGLWRSVTATTALELSMLAGGLWMYVRSTEPADRIGSYALVGFTLALVAWEQLDYAQAGRVVGCSAATFAVRVSRARGKLRDALQPAPVGVPRAKERTA